MNLRAKYPLASTKVSRKLNGLDADKSCAFKRQNMPARFGQTLI